MSEPYLSPAERRTAIETAAKRVDRERLQELLRGIVDVPSPTGEEASLARHLCGVLEASDLEGREQRIDERQSNATGRVAGEGGGASLLLYSPVDTVTVGNAEEDLPWAGEELRRDMRPRSWVEGDTVFGLGAQNPKGHAACVVAAAEAIRGAGIRLAGDLRIGLGAGGMPTNARSGNRPGSGHGAGCDHLLRSQALPDHAVIAKSGWAVSWEEVGLAWFEIRVMGTHTYVGARHLLPYLNCIERAAAVIQRLEAWFPTWAEEERSGLVMPQGVVSFIEGGWERMPAFTPAVCRFRIDLRLSPRTTPDQAEEQLRTELARISREVDAELELRRLVAIPGTTTPKDSWIVQAAIDAWEEVAGRGHEALVGMSGATDANILRAHGVPTARVGLGKIDVPDIDFQLGMNAAKLSDMEQLTRLLIHVAIETCTRPRGETLS